MNPVSIGSRAEMLVDDALLAQYEGLGFQLTPPQRREIAIRADAPWEGEASLAYVSVFAHRGRYHMYYRAGINTTGDDRDPDQFLCYATSGDGIHWEKPVLGLIAFAGNTDNNILMTGKECHNFTPFLDTNPACPEAERIKAVAGYAPEGLFVYASADGLHFHKMVDTPAVTGALLDSQNVMLYDAASAQYRIYSRYFAPSAYGIDHPTEGKGLRAIRCSVSTDLRHWSEPMGNRYTNGEQTEHLYTNATTPCPGAEHMLLSFPMRFVDGVNLHPMRKYPGISDAVFMTSRDGHLWDRRFMDSWIAGGLDHKNWTQRNQMVARGVLSLDAESLSVYVLNHYCWPDAAIVRYSVRNLGFASLRAAERTGRFATVPLIFAGDALQLNFRTAAVGAIRVGLQDPADGTFYEGFSLEDCTPLRGDALWQTVRFAGGPLSGLAGRPVVLTGEMRLADLYAYRFC